MIDDRTFHIAELIIQMIGLLFVVFKWGRYIGEANQMFKNIFRDLRDVEGRLKDSEKTIGDIRVSVAGIKGEHV